MKGDILKYFISYGWYRNCTSAPSTHKFAFGLKILAILVNSDRTQSVLLVHLNVDFSISCSMPNATLTLQDPGRPSH